jgi:predicted phosphoribosyltransferase
LALAMHAVRSMTVFQDRRDAGRQLARKLERYVGAANVLVLGLPRGGVPVAFELAMYLAAPLDVLVVRKLGVPGHEEVAMGAIASGGIEVVEQDIVDRSGITNERFQAVVDAERKELDRREKAFRGGRPPLDVTGKIAIVVDDGLATGSSMAAALDALRTRAPARLVAAVPLAPPDRCKALQARADEMICLVTPPRMYAVGVWYRDFTQTTDQEVRTLLASAAHAVPGKAPRAEPAVPKR